MADGGNYQDVPETVKVDAAAEEHLHIRSRVYLPDEDIPEHDHHRHHQAQGISKEVEMPEFIQVESHGDFERASIRSGSLNSTEHTREMKKSFRQRSSVQFSLKSRVKRILSFSAVFGIEKAVCDVYRIFTVILVTGSTMLYIVNSMPQVYEPQLALDFSKWYMSCEVVLALLFTVDFVLRLTVMDSLRDLASVHVLVDFFSFVGTYIEVALGDTGATPSNTAGFTLLRLLRIARILRLFKLSRQDGGLSMLWHVLLKSKDGLFLLVVLVGIAIMVFASIFYYIEIVSCEFDSTRRLWLRLDGSVSPFQSIPHTFWFIAATVTTVGYGDETPGSLGGRAWIVLVMLFGVLLLSFPNILIGSNFSEVHSMMRKENARRNLGKHFRKVLVVVRFIRMWRELRLSGRIALAGSPALEVGVRYQERLVRRMDFFLFRLSDFPDRGLVELTSKFGGTCALEAVMWQGLTLQHLLQRLLECFSGCATVEELTQSFHCFPIRALPKPPAMDVVYELALRAAALNQISAFILHREDESALLYISRKGVESLLSYHETEATPCMRCHQEARNMWYATTHMAPLDFLPIDGYRTWQGIEGRMTKRSPLDFTYDLKLNESNLNDIFRGVSIPDGQTQKKPREGKCMCRHCNLLWGIAAPARPRVDYCFEPDEELYDLEITYMQNAKKIRRLEQRIAELEAQSSLVEAEGLRCSFLRPTNTPRASVQQQPSTPLLVAPMSADDAASAFEQNLSYTTRALSRTVDASPPARTPQHNDDDDPVSIPVAHEPQLPPQVPETAATIRVQKASPSPSSSGSAGAMTLTADSGAAPLAVVHHK